MLRRSARFAARRWCARAQVRAPIISRAWRRPWAALRTFGPALRIRADRVSIRGAYLSVLAGVVQAEPTAIDINCFASDVACLRAGKKRHDVADLARRAQPLQGGA